MKQLEFKKSLELLKKYHIDCANSRFIESEKELDKIKYPIAMKVADDEIVHKSDVGGVIIGIRDKKDAIDSFKKLKKIGNDIIIQDMKKGNEIVIGMKRDSQFGPVIMFGLGGIFVEAIKDVSFRVCPTGKREAMDMIRETKVYNILKGMRGEKSANINAIIDMITKVSELSLKEKKINEIDLNPVIVNNKEAVVVDARFMI